MTEPSLTLAEASGLAAAVLDQVERAVIGKRDALSLVLAGVLAGGHVLIEDLPGLGKTVAAHSLATALGLAYTRAQFTPDLLPSDLTGGYIYDQRASEFVFRPGPVFTGLLLADEINRTPPKTQSALLEAMQEHRVSVEGHTFDLPRPFHVLATANPIEHEGTYPLPEAQLDRFLMRLSFGYPSATDEVDVLARRIERRKEEATIDAVLDPERLLAVQDAVEDIYIAPSVLRYVVRLVSATRVDKSVLVGASPRGSLALVACSRAVALLDGRSFVAPEDIKAVAHGALDHRITLRPELWLSDATAAAVVETALNETPVPDPTDAGARTLPAAGDPARPGWHRLRSARGGGHGHAVRRPRRLGVADPCPYRRGPSTHTAAARRRSRGRLGARTDRGRSTGMVAGSVVAAAIRAEARPEGRGRHRHHGRQGRGGAAHVGPLPRRTARGRGDGRVRVVAGRGRGHPGVRGGPASGSQPRRFERRHASDRYGRQPFVGDAGGGEPARRAARVPPRRPPQEDQLAGDLAYRPAPRRDDAHRERHRRPPGHGHPARRPRAHRDRCDLT